MVFFLAALILAANVLAVAPHLHERLHCDAKSPQHQCAVTLFEHGQIEAASADICLALGFQLFDSSPLAVYNHFAPAIEHLPAGRAPPVSSSNS